MFKKAMSTSLQNIFDLEKVSFDTPSDSKEQDCIFVEIQSSKNQIKDGTEVAKVMGKLVVFANMDKLPYGYFSKKIKAANASDTKPFYFYDFEESSGVFLNIIQMSLSFVYFFNSQYDPAMGTITSINITES